jgi:hypothetical protein
MAQSYFPWGSDAKPQASSSGSPNAHLAQPDVRNRARTPPPPRRVQSEAQVQHVVNPRGVATRHGIPAFADEIEEKVQRTASPDEVFNGPRMSLGPSDSERVLGEVLDSHGPTRRKNKND